MQISSTQKFREKEHITQRLSGDKLTAQEVAGEGAEAEVRKQERDE